MCHAPTMQDVWGTVGVGAEGTTYLDGCECMKQFQSALFLQNGGMLTCDIILVGGVP